MKSVPLSECLVNFLSDVGPSSATRHTVLIGHNSSAFDTPTLLRCTGLDFKQTLSSMNVSFADRLHVVRTLTKSGHTLLNPRGKACKSNLPSAFKTPFDKNFQAHEALKDVRALRLVLFESLLKLTDADIGNNSNLKLASFAFEEMVYFDERFVRMQTFKDKLLSQSGNGLIKQSLIQKLTESGLSYQDLRHLFSTGGKEALVTVLSRAPTGANRSAPLCARVCSVKLCWVLCLFVTFKGSTLKSSWNKTLSTDSDIYFVSQSNTVLAIRTSSARLSTSQSHPRVNRFSRMYLVGELLKRTSLYGRPSPPKIQGCQID